MILLTTSTSDTATTLYKLKIGFVVNDPIYFPKRMKPSEFCFIINLLDGLTTNNNIITESLLAEINKKIMDKTYPDIDQLTAYIRISLIREFNILKKINKKNLINNIIINSSRFDFLNSPATCLGVKESIRFYGGYRYEELLDLFFKFSYDYFCGIDIENSLKLGLLTFINNEFYHLKNNKLLYYKEYTNQLISIIINYNSIIKLINGQDSVSIKK